VPFPIQANSVEKRGALLVGLTIGVVAYLVSLLVSWLSIPLAWLCLALAAIEFLIRRDFSKQSVSLFGMVLFGSLAAIMTANQIW
jgi:hypothetical protein